MGLGHPGRIALEFIREAPTALEAILSGIRDVHAAVPSAVLIEAAPDYVGLSEIANFVSVSRQNLRKLSLAHSDTFPAPVHAGSASIYHLCDVLEWLSRQVGYEIGHEIQEVAKANLQMNLSKELHMHRHAVDAALLHTT